VPLDEVQKHFWLSASGMELAQLMGSEQFVPPELEALRQEFIKRRRDVARAELKCGSGFAGRFQDR